MSKEWYEESSEEFANGFTEERQVHHMAPPEQELEKTYRPADLVAIIYSFTARLYGQRRAMRKTEAFVEQLKSEDK